MCLLKKEAMEFAIQKTAEIGVDRIIPVLSARTVVEIGGKKIKDKILTEISDDEIRANLSDANVLILELTQNCNLRCRYCSFSGIYDSYSYRGHNTKRMSIETARKSIDFFFSQVNSCFRSKKLDDLSVNFYGGESLLEYKTMMTCVEYVNQRIKGDLKKIKFIINTNGLLLMPPIVESLMKYDFMVNISLDGPEDQHDRFRVQPDGSPSWKKILQNIEFIKTKFPKYFDKRIVFFVTLHPEHDILELEKYFLSNPELFHEGNVRINPVNIRGLAKDTMKCWKEALKKQSKEIHTKLDKSKWFYKTLISEGLEEKITIRGTHVLSQTYFFTGNCFPGGIRLFVNSDGEFHICEKISSGFSIGNISQGYDIEKIKSIVNGWKKQIVQLKCWKCSIWHACPACFAQFPSTDNSPSPSFTITQQDCKNWKKGYKMAFDKYIRLKEQELKNEVNEDHHIDTFIDLLESM